LFQRLIWPVSFDTIKSESEWCLKHLCVIAERSGDLSRAAEAWKKLASQTEILQNFPNADSIRCYLEAGRVYRLTVRPTLSRECLLGALSRLKKCPDRTLSSRLYEEMALLEESEENLSEALSLFREAIRHHVIGRHAQRFVRLLYRKARLEL